VFEHFKSLNIIWLYAIAMVFYCGADILSKYFGMKPTLFMGSTVMTCYIVGTFCWLGIMAQRNELALMSLIWQILATITSVSVGVLYFQEKLTMVQWSGAAFAIVGFILLSK
jgi:multidrug transporter EmrE-like cation transporter